MGLACTPVYRTDALSEIGHTRREASRGPSVDDLLGSELEPKRKGRRWNQGMSRPQWGHFVSWLGSSSDGPAGMNIELT